jgi:hypothetical protein
VGRNENRCAFLGKRHRGSWAVSLVQLGSIQ